MLIGGGSSRSATLMLTLDSINCKMGKDALFMASSGIGKAWRMQQGNKSSCYTTDWKQLASARC